MADNIVEVTNTRNNEVFCSLCIIGYNFEPDDISKILDLVPSTTRRRGEPWTKPESLYGPGKKVRIAKEDYWEIEAPGTPRSELEDEVNALLEILMPKAKRFANLPADIEVMFSCAVYAREDTPAMYFTKQQIRQIAELGVSLDIDFYYFVKSHKDE